MTRAHVLPASITAGGSRQRRRVLLGSTAALALVLTACGGGDDEADPTTLPTTTTLPTSITQPTITQPTITQPSTAPPASAVYVTEGATVMVVNASRIDGAAGRMSERLAAVEFQMVEPANYTLGQLDVSKIYFDVGNPQAKAVADSLKAGFGGGAIEVLELPTPPPVDSGDLKGAGVLVAMGNDIADKTLDELQGITPPPTSAPETATASETGTASETASDTATD